MATQFNNKGKFLLEGNTFYPGDYITGQDGNCLVFQEDGNLVQYNNLVYRDKEHAIWHSDTKEGNIGKYLKFENGNLRTYDNNDKLIWESKFPEEQNLNCLMLVDYHLVFAHIPPTNRRILNENTGNADFSCPDYISDRLYGSTSFIPPTNYDLIEKKQNVTRKEKYQLDFDNFNKIRDVNNKPLSGAILIVGSLLWDKGEANLREEWRNEYLVMSEMKRIEAPIRYGRKSKGDVTTMVLDHSSERGTAYIVPLNSNFGIGDQIKAALKSEGIYSGEGVKLYGTSSKDIWAVVGVGIKDHVYRQKFNAVT